MRPIIRPRLRSLLLGLAAPLAGCGAVIDPPAAQPKPLPTAEAGAVEAPAESEWTLSAEAAPAAEPATALQPPPREPIYIEEANGEALIAAALNRAQAGNKRVLIEWGGNWCGWCYRLHDTFHQDALVRPVLESSYELVLIDSGPNRDLMKHYGGNDRQYSYPHLTVLNSQGEVLTNQNTEPLEQGKGHSGERVAEFLRTWAPGAEEASPPSTSGESSTPAPGS
ncbi:MAG: thioredoxin family protein [Planctomyces sp.]|nr:thioredoxin family protein [Planctomyces sp.]